MKESYRFQKGVAKETGDWENTIVEKKHTTEQSETKNNNNITCTSRFWMWVEEREREKGAKEWKPQNTDLVCPIFELFTTPHTSVAVKFMIKACTAVTDLGHKKQAFFVPHDIDVSDTFEMDMDTMQVMVMMNLNERLQERDRETETERQCADGPEIRE